MKEIIIDDFKYRIELDQFLGLEIATLIDVPSLKTDIIIPSYIVDENKEIPVVKIGNKCFFKKKASLIILPDTILSIGERCFYCSEIKKMYLPDSIIELGLSAFESCSNLEEINVPSQLHYIPARCFLYNHALHINKLPNSIKYIDTCGFQDVTFDELHFSGKTKFIGWDAFRLAKVDKIIADEGLKVVGPGAFRQNKFLSYIDLPSTVEELGNGFAHDCPSLTKLVVRAKEPPHTPNKLEHCNYFSDNMMENLVVYVPKESLEKYKNDYGWRNVRNFQPI